MLFVDLPTAPEAGPDFATARRIKTRAHLPLLMGGSLRTAEHVRAAKAVPGLQGVLVDALLFIRDPGMVEFLSSTCA
jgi:uncharacterized protein related to proFAR isomerase